MAAHILLVDDNADAREILAIILQAEGYRTSQASDGQHALEVMRADRPDVVIMDIFMPIMDGVKATKIMRESASLERIPVLAHTARPSGLQQERDLFFAILAKPCSPDTALTAIKQAL